MSGSANIDIEMNVNYSANGGMQLDHRQRSHAGLRATERTPESFFEATERLSRRALAISVFGMLILTIKYMWQTRSGNESSGPDETDPGNPMTALLILSALLTLYAWSKKSSEGTDGQQLVLAPEAGGAVLLTHRPHAGAGYVDVEVALKALPLSAFTRPRKEEHLELPPVTAALVAVASSAAAEGSCKGGSQGDGAQPPTPSCVVIPMARLPAVAGGAAEPPAASGGSGGVKGGKGALTSRPSCCSWSDSDECPCCVVCLDPVREGDLVLTLPCSHNQFHAACITPWLRQQAGEAACPLCKAPVFEARRHVSTEQQQ